MKRDELRRLNRDELLARAEALGVARPAVLTQGELIDEIVKRVAPTASGVRGWLGRARDLVAQVVSKGLHLPDAARLFRSEPPEPLPPPPPPLPTVTLAEIYVAQGHLAKGLAVIEQVLAREPGHPVARELADTWRRKLGRGGPASATADASEAQAEAPTEASEAVEPSLATDASVAIDASEAVEPSLATDASATADASEAQAEAPAEANEPTATATHAEASTIARDALELAPVSSQALALAWELRPARYAYALAGAPAGALVLRTFAAHAASGAVVTAQSDTPVEGVRGAVVIRGLAPKAHVRACLGWKSGATFAPLVIGRGVAMPDHGAVGSHAPGATASLREALARTIASASTVAAS